MRENYMSTERFKVRQELLFNMAAIYPASLLMSGVSTDGCHQFVSHGGFLLLHWCQLSAALPSAAEGGNRLSICLSIYPSFSGDTDAGLHHRIDDDLIYFILFFYQKGF